VSDTRGGGGGEPDWSGCRPLADLSPGQVAHLDRCLDTVEESDDRSRSEWSVFMFAAKCKLCPDDLWTMMRWCGKVGERGRSYFDLTYSRAWNNARGNS